MTVNSTTNRVSYAGNGTTNPLPVSFPFQLQADLKVVETTISTGGQNTKVITTDYTITGSTDSNGFYPNGGNVVPVVAVPVTVTWTILRDPVKTQQVQHVDNDSIPAASIDNPLDKLTMIDQRLSDRLDRALVAPDGDPPASMQIPNAVSRASKVLSFDASGLPTVSDPAVTAATAAAATAVAAAASVGATVGLWTRPVKSLNSGPPGSPAVGDRYLISHSGTSGAWVGHEDNVAEWTSGGWIYSGAPLTNQFLEVGTTPYRYSQEAFDSGVAWRPAYFITAGPRGTFDPVDQPAVVGGWNRNGRAGCLGLYSETSSAMPMHWNTFAGSIAAPTMPLSGTNIMSVGARCYDSGTGLFSASSSAIQTVLTENARSGFAYSGCQMQLETTDNGGLGTRAYGLIVAPDGAVISYGTSGLLTATLSTTGSHRYFYGRGSDAGAGIQSNANTTLLLNRNASDGVVVDFRRNQSTVGTISCTTTTTTYATSSDERLKNFQVPQRDFEAMIDAIEIGDAEFNADPGNYILSVKAQQVAASGYLEAVIFPENEMVQDTDAAGNLKWGEPRKHIGEDGNPVKNSDGVEMTIPVPVMRRETDAEAHHRNWHADYGRFGVLALKGLQIERAKSAALRADVEQCFKEIALLKAKA